MCRAHAGGKEEYARGLCSRLIESFLVVEEQFEAGGKSTVQEVIDSLRQVGWDGVRWVGGVPGVSVVLLCCSPFSHCNPCL